MPPLGKIFSGFKAVPTGWPSISKTCSSCAKTRPCFRCVVTPIFKPFLPSPDAGAYG